MNKIRNFSIIAHIDHGKSTLSDRLIQFCGGLSQREMAEQVLDSMDLERERGITIKAQSVTLNYKALDNQIYQLNFIDTPGHIDFFYEVSRSLAASEGALLLVDTKQGVEAQTIAHCHTAMEMNLKIIPVLNKIDLPFSNPDRVSQEIKDILGIHITDAVRCSAKTGVGIPSLLECIVRNIPPPQGDPHSPLQALIIDSWFNKYLGVVSLICIKNGILRKGDKIQVMRTKRIYHVDKMGIFTPKRIDREVLNCGEIGWLVCTIKDIHGAQVGDTLTLARNPAVKALPGFKKVKPQVYASLILINSEDYENFRDALERLSLNDSALFYAPERSTALGCGFRCGFLGLLHMDIIQERLRREYSLNFITTAPTVIYEVLTTDNDIIYVDHPSNLPPLHNIAEIREPIAECYMLLPQIYLGNIITLCIEHRGVQIGIEYYTNHVALTYEIPMVEVVINLFDKLQSISHGYASLEYSFKHFRRSDIVRLDILINNEKIDSFSWIIHRDHALYQSRMFVDKLHQFIPRQQFDIVIQAAINNHIVARLNVKQLRKNVLSKCYGGDVSRKKKLLKRQKEGKKHMKQIGTVKLSQETFLEILRVAPRNNK